MKPNVRAVDEVGSSPPFRTIESLHRRQSPLAAACESFGAPQSSAAPFVARTRGAALDAPSGR